MSALQAEGHWFESSIIHSNNYNSNNYKEIILINSYKESLSSKGYSNNYNSNNYKEIILINSYKESLSSKGLGQEPSKFLM